MRWNILFFFFSSRRRHTRYIGDWSSDVCSSDLVGAGDHKTRAEADQLALQRDIVADAADAQHLAVCPAGLRDALIGLAQTRVVDLPRNAIIRRQVARA